MHWSWSGDRSLGGKMLNKFILLSFLLSSFNAFACWKMEGTVAIDGETWKIDQKFDHNKEYIMPMGPFIVKLTVTSASGKKPGLKYIIQEKKDLKLILVGQGEEKDLAEKIKHDIFAKGDDGRPHSIITIKLLPL